MKKQKIAKKKEKKFECVVCGSDTPGATLHDYLFGDGREINYQLCPNHISVAVNLELKPSEFFKMWEYAGGATFWTHDDFYNSATGYAYQPRSRRE